MGYRNSSGRLNYDVYRFLTNKAAALANSATYGGSHGDGGSSQLLDVVDAYKAGCNNDPLESVKAVKRYAAEYRRQTDPDYAQYLKLKDTFEPTR